MKSKTVASILRHVASKIPSVTGDGTEKEAAPAAEPAEKESKKAARKARQAAQEEGAEVEHEIPGGGNEEEKLEQLYEQIAWPLGKKYGHPYDAFKLALTYVYIYYPLLIRSCPVPTFKRGRYCFLVIIHSNLPFDTLNSHKHHC